MTDPKKEQIFNELNEKDTQPVFFSPDAVIEFTKTAGSLTKILIIIFVVGFVLRYYSDISGLIEIVRSQFTNGFNLISILIPFLFNAISIVIFIVLIHLGIKGFKNLLDGFLIIEENSRTDQ